MRKIAEPPNEEDRRIAVHETGHAVFAALNEFYIVKVTLHQNCTVDDNRDKDEKDKVCLRDNPLDDDDYQEKSLDVWQAYYAAGAAAEYIIFGEIREYATKADECCHKRLSEKHKSSETFDEAIKRAVDFLHNQKEKLLMVAEELKKKRVFGTDCVYDLLGIQPPWNRPAKS